MGAILVSAVIVSTAIWGKYKVDRMGATINRIAAILEEDVKEHQNHLQQLGDITLKISDLNVRTVKLELMTGDSNIEDITAAYDASAETLKTLGKTKELLDLYVDASIFFSVQHQQELADRYYLLAREIAGSQF